MIIDEILDFKYFKENNQKFEPDMKYIYDEAIIFNFDYLLKALDNGTNEDIQKALCEYIDNNEHNPAIKDFINSINWQQYADAQS